MGALGRWIDELTPEQKDKIIEAQGWGASLVPESDWPCNACLIDHVFEGHSRDYGAYKIPHHYLGVLRERSVSTQYEHLFKRFGERRVVRALKMRAGLAFVVSLNEESSPQLSEVN